LNIIHPPFYPIVVQDLLFQFHFLFLK
jgi:hypothetical protein